MKMDRMLLPLWYQARNPMLTQMDNDVDILAMRMGKYLAKKCFEFESLCMTVIISPRPSPDIYNPFSLLNAFANSKINLLLVEAVVHLPI